MINRNDLRIGNLVTTDKDGIITVTSIFTLGIHNENHNGREYNEIKGIQLTEEWLLKFGFDKEEYRKGYIGIDTNFTSFVLTEPNEFKDNYTFHFETGKVPMYKPVEYVHELQNLYFTLTGEELELKL